MRCYTCWSNNCLLFSHLKHHTWTHHTGRLRCFCFAGAICCTHFTMITPLLALQRSTSVFVCWTALWEAGNCVQRSDIMTRSLLAALARQIVMKCVAASSNPWRKLLWPKFSLCYLEKQISASIISSTWKFLPVSKVFWSTGFSSIVLLFSKFQKMQTANVRLPCRACMFSFFFFFVKWVKLLLWDGSSPTLCSHPTWSIIHLLQTTCFAP